MRWFDRSRVRLRLLFGRDAAESRMNDEFQFHIEMETNQLIRGRGLAPDEARRQALAAFGGVEEHKEALRDGRGMAWFGGMSLDVKLGLRMMRKYPGVSLGIVLALAIGIPVSLLPGHLIQAAVGASPPFDQGERVVGIIGVGQAGKTALHIGDYEQVLLQGPTTFASLAATIPVEVNVTSGDGGSEGERGALMSASSFALARVAPMMGRVLVVADEAQGAPDVAVVGYRFWRRRLGGAADVVGSTLRVAGVPTTIVGVMPEGFAMPSTEQIWLPLRQRSADDTVGLGPAVWIYGRLADEVSFAQARAELRTMRLQTAPGEHPDQRWADVVAFSTVEVGEPQGLVGRIVFAATQAVPVMLLLVACGNIGILILARLATRSGELAIRTVLGASRARILGQLFVETLLLALVATGVGLFAIDMAVAWLAPRFTLPFWFDPGVTPAFAVKALAVSVLCAVVAGVLPAQRATRGMLQQTIRSAGMGGGTLRLGRVAGALIIIEVGVGTAALFTGGALWLLFEPNPDAHTQVADPDRYLVASIRMPPSARSHSAAGGDDVLRARLASLQEDLGRRLTAQPGVRRWAFSDQPPGEEANERTVRVEGDGRLPDDPGLPGVATFVDPAFFDLLDVSPASGRLFGPGDASLDPAVEPTAAIVNIKFLERRGMSPQSALGARIQFTDGRGPGPGPWKEIIGVVPNIEPSENRVFADGTPVVFLPAMPGTLNPMTLTIDLGSEPLAFASRLRVLVTEADPAVLVEDVYALDHLHGEVNVFAILTSVTAGLALLAILLSTTGLYALMSMTVAQRRREFGIRIALGGSARRVMMAVARRALVQIAVGVALGAGFWLVVISVALTGGEAERTLTQWPFLLAASAAVVTAIALAASLGPTLRYVRMQPSETLRDSTSWHRSCRLRY